MSTLIDQPETAICSNGRIRVTMASGLEFSFPVEGNPRLAGKPDAVLANIELSPFGLHWPELDEDLSIRGILAGDYGQPRVRAA